MKILKINLLILFVLFLSLISASAMDVTLEWDENADADYYVISYGDQSRITTPYTNQTGQILKGTTQYTFSGLEDKTYFFGVKAFNKCGNSSDFSEEVSNGILPGVVSSVVVKTCVTYKAVD